MNANELADELAFKHIAGDDSGAFSSKIITMLRQQQAEIESLKAELVRYADALGDERGNKALKNHEIAAILTQVLDDCGLIRKAQKK
jgi:hypothetical protein